IGQLERLRAEFPPGFLTLLEIQGLGPRTAKLLYDELGVDSIERLGQLCRDQQIVGGAGVKQKTCEDILKTIERWKARGARTPLAHAHAIATQIVDALSAHGGVERIEIAGSLRRLRETVRDVDLLVTSTAPARVMDTFTSLPSVTEVILRGDTR